MAKAKEKPHRWGEARICKNCKKMKFTFSKKQPEYCAACGK